VLLLVLMASLAVWIRQAQSWPARTHAVRAVADSPAGRAVLNASGYVVARREATVSSKVTGKVAEVLIEEGMRVEAGQVLARLDDTNVRAGLNLSEAQLAAARTVRAETTAQLERADSELRRISSLRADRIASDSDLEDVQAQVRVLRARLERQEAEVVVAQREMALWQQHMDDTVIRAPFAGIATSKNAQPGEMISPVSAGGGFTRTGIGTIVDMESLEIEVDVNESYINRVTADQAVEAILDAYPDWRIPCRVIAVIPTADRQKATVRVRVKFDQLDPRILPQMSVKVAFLAPAQGNSAAQGITVPKSAVRREAGEDRVFLVQEGRARKRTVTIQRTDRDTVIVQGGLAPGDRVILDAPPRLADGARVRELSR
jgi:RND family efflux transporter MFP subunit